MADVDPSKLSTLFYSGSSPFLQANECFVRAMITASHQCSIHASEDIYDANGLKLWARGRAVDERLLERLSNRKLRKPIELCVIAGDPIAHAGLTGAIEVAVDMQEGLRAALEPKLAGILDTVRAIAPNPTELMLLSVMRHGERDMIPHAALVAAVALAMGLEADEHSDVMRRLARAALLHDVGELYLPPDLFKPQGPRTTEQILEIRRHPVLGARIASELARCAATVGHLIGLSHERLDGWGYPHGLKREDLPVAAQALLFAEALAPLLESPRNGMRRAAIAARLAPGEFAPRMVNWIVSNARQAPIAPQPDLSADAIALDLRQAHAVLTQVHATLGAQARGETTRVRAAAVQWHAAVDSLMRELRMTGVDEAIECGLEIEPQNDAEAIELAVLSQELQYRVRSLLLRVRLASNEEPELGSSSLVVELIEALAACQPVPLSAASVDAAHVLPWSRLYSVGIQAIDDQHRVIVDLLNRLGAAARGPSGQDPARDVLARLAQYVGEHFAFEEALMREHGHERTEAHLAEHARLAERVQGLIRQQGEGAAPTLEELIVFLRQWLIGHILHADRALGHDLNARGVH